MKVRELIRALQAHDQDMDVIVPSDPGQGEDYAGVGAVEVDVFRADAQAPGNLHLSELRDRGAFTAVRLCTARP